MMAVKTEKTPEQVARFDPWPARPPIRANDAVWAAPVRWTQMPDGMRQVFGGGLVEILAATPSATKRDVGALAHSVWSRVRGEMCDVNGRQERIDFALRDLPNVGDPISLIEDALRRLLDVGSVLEILKSERDRLTVAIDALEAMTTRGAEGAR